MTDQLLLILSLFLLSFQTLYLTFCIHRISQSFIDLEKTHKRIFDLLFLLKPKLDRDKYLQELVAMNAQLMGKVKDRPDIFKTFELKLDKNAQQGELILQTILKASREANFDAARIKTRQTNERKRDTRSRKK